jgi:flagellar hook-associated protein 3 FlgL
MVSRIATFPSTARLIRDNMTTQSKLSFAQEAISSGLKTENYKGLSTQSQRLLSLESTYERLNGHVEDGKIVGLRIERMYETVGGMIERATNFVSALAAALGGDFVAPGVTQAQAQVGMDEFAGLLNISQAGRYLFGGNDIANPPVNLANPGWTAQVPPSVANFTYYEGDTTILSVQASDTMNITYGALANDPAFEQALRAYNLAVNNPANNVALNEAFDLMQGAIDGMAIIQARLSESARALESQVEDNKTDLSNLDDAIGGIKSVDLAAASVEIKGYETQLEASYAASVKVIQLSLHNYL